MNNTFKIGDDVVEKDDPKHVGRVEQIGVPNSARTGQTYVRWNRSYATWIMAHRLQMSKVPYKTLPRKGGLS